MRQLSGKYLWYARLELSMITTRIWPKEHYSKLSSRLHISSMTYKSTFTLQIHTTDVWVFFFFAFLKKKFSSPLRYLAFQDNCLRMQYFKMKYTSLESLKQVCYMFLTYLYLYLFLIHKYHFRYLP